MRFYTFSGFAAALLFVCATPVETNAQGYHRQAQTSAQRSAGVPGVGQSGVVSNARPVSAQASLMGIQKGMTAFAMDVGRLPTGAEGLNALLYPPPGVQNWRGPYIARNNWRQAFSDPWGSLYRYVVQGTGRQAVHYIISNGPDRIPGTRDDLSVQF